MRSSCLSAGSIRPPARRGRSQEYKKRVIEAINRLGQPNEVEVPAAPDPTFAQAVADWQQASGVKFENAVLLRAIAPGLRIPQVYSEKFDCP